jgi:hypothetical protein
VSGLVGIVRPSIDAGSGALVPRSVETVEPAPAHLIGVGFALAAAALGIAADTGPLVPVLAGAVALGGLARARVASTVALLGVAPLLGVIGWADATLTAAAACLAAAAIAMLAAAGDGGGRGDAALALRVTTGALMLTCTSLLLTFVAFYVV